MVVTVGLIESMGIEEFSMRSDAKPRVGLNPVPCISLSKNPLTDMHNTRSDPNVCPVPGANVSCWAIRTSLVSPSVTRAQQGMQPR